MNTSPLVFPKRFGLLAFLFFPITLCLILIGCIGREDSAPPTIMQSPNAQVVMVGQTATFAVISSGQDLTYQWQKGDVDIVGASRVAFTTPPTAAADNGSQFRVVVSNLAGTVTTESATLTVHTKVPADAVTFHNDVGRTGQNLHETILTPQNVTSTTFGKLWFYSTDGHVDAQPLYLENLTIPGQSARNVLYVVTEHDSAYALDADTSALLWRVSLLGDGETPSDPRACGTINPEIGIAQTPVIDRTRGPHGAIYMVAMSKNSAGEYVQRLHALDIATGAELFGGPAEIQASYPGTGDNSSKGQVTFDPKQYKERSALLLVNGTVILTWGSHCDIPPYNGWVMGYDATTLMQSSVLNVTPNANAGSIWSAGGPASDASGNIYVLDANGHFDTDLDENGFPGKGDYGNAFIKLATPSGLKVVDYFATFDTVHQSAIDYDLGSASPLILPDLKDGAGHVQHLAVGAGKDANLYVVDRDAMGRFDPKANNIYEQVAATSKAEIMTAPVYFNNTVFYAPSWDSIKAFSIKNARLSSVPVDETTVSFDYPGAAASISANDNADAILWVAHNSSPVAALHAYDPTNLSVEFYNSFSAAGSRDWFGIGSRFIPPTIANGKVYVGAATGVAAFGHLQ